MASQNTLSRPVYADKPGKGGEGANGHFVVLGTLNVWTRKML